MKHTTLADSFDKFMLLTGVEYENTGGKDIIRKLKVLEHAKTFHNATFRGRHFGISRDGFYKWKRAYEVRGEKGLINN